MLFVKTQRNKALRIRHASFRMGQAGHAARAKGACAKGHPAVALQYSKIAKRRAQRDQKQRSTVQTDTVNKQMQRISNAKQHRIAVTLRKIINVF